ncbi:galactosylgalactosylxylosylprotein 3-beta-glucuronosyltransferase S-like isoform X2 [Penaeus monodon]|uniref:galactosylgalactosylxylosylprotein 3-beta-glucuronosyltransferase S-like isoform X2 n=1 Tax=Penaeus monodon TaxID=6687 RepID=UPI0018A7DFAF|nr:galactosylgalactosylxylosylprotein 3-beta-glucuronosyltransferase S-like isoform X2 [Penaeus monodon]
MNHFTCHTAYFVLVFLSIILPSDCLSIAPYSALRDAHLNKSFHFHFDVILLVITCIFLSSYLIPFSFPTASLRSPALFPRAEMALIRRPCYLVCVAPFALAMVAFMGLSSGGIEGGGAARRGLQDAGGRSTGRTIYVVTATYPRSNQIPEMTRLAQTLMLVPDVHWIVAEDARVKNERLVQYLRSTGIPFTYMITPMPSAARHWHHWPTGVANRRAALAWIRKNAETGVVYIADDDNIYDIRLFEEIRSTRGVSIFPVAFLLPSQLTTPVLREGRFMEFYDGWKVTRKYPVDMAGFAVSVELLLKRPQANMHWSYSYQEESLLASLGVAPEDIEFKAENCTKSENSACSTRPAARLTEGTP